MSLLAPGPGRFHPNCAPIHTQSPQHYQPITPVPLHPEAILSPENHAEIHSCPASRFPRQWRPLPRSGHRRGQAPFLPELPPPRPARPHRRPRQRITRRLRGDPPEPPPAHCPPRLHRTGSRRGDVRRLLAPPPALVHGTQGPRPRTRHPGFPRPVGVHRQRLRLAGPQPSPLPPAAPLRNSPPQRHPALARPHPHAAPHRDAKRTRQLPALPRGLGFAGRFTECSAASPARRIRATGA